MKFTDGFWVLKPGVQMFNCTQVQDTRWEGDSFAVFCSHIPVTDRGMTLNAPLLTLTFRAPRPGILSLRLEHFQGSANIEPKFELNETGMQPTVTYDADEIRVSSGALTAVISKNKFSLAFFEDGVRLTGLGSRHMGYAKTPSGNHMRVKLDIGVGEKIYGLGERFTPFVKNGQSIEIWNEDGGTASELAYKNIPFYVTNRGYGVFVNSSGKISFELCTEAVESAQFSLPGESLEFMIIGGGSMKKVIEVYTALTGRAALPPAWTFGLWLTTSFTTKYNEETVMEFVEGMSQRGIPLHVFHFDCFWMKAYEWCSYEWDMDSFHDPVGMLKQLKEKGLKTCVWINPYIAQKSPLFKEAKEAGYLLRRKNGDVWQWDMWQAGMGLIDFTNPGARDWFKSKLKALLDMGIDSFKTDFGERIPVDCVYFDGSDPELMHNYYTLIYNRTVFELLEQERGQGEACVFARSATVGGQKYPVHWGGDSTSTFPSMAESLRAGLSLCLSGFSFWSHDISGFEDTASPEVYIRWAQFGLLSSHSRLHGSTSYRVPWLFGEDAPVIVKQYTNLKCRLMPYLYAKSVEARDTGLPLMRPLVMEFPEDRMCEDIDLQYMLGDSLMVAPIFREDNLAEYYLPQGNWTHLLNARRVHGGHWHKEKYALDDMPLFVRENSILAFGQSENLVDYDYLDGLEVRVYQPNDAGAKTRIVDRQGINMLTVSVKKSHGAVRVSVVGDHKGLDIKVYLESEMVCGRIEPDSDEMELIV